MKKRVLCFGDSNTWGYVAGTGERYGEDTRWTRVCQAALGDDYEILEDGLNGRTSVYDRPWSPYRKGIDSLGYSLLAQMPLDLIVIFLGTNDLSMVPMIRCVQGVSEIVRTAKYANEIFHVGMAGAIFPKEAKILLIAPMPYHPVIDTMPDAPAYGKYRDSLRFAEKFRGIADEFGTEYLDAAQYAESSEVDGVHLTAESHKRLGFAVAEKIREILE